MTFQKLYEEIGNLTPQQRQRPAVIGMRQTGEAAEIKSLIPIKEFNDTQLPNQFTLMYDNYRDPAIH